MNALGINDENKKCGSCSKNHIEFKGVLFAVTFSFFGFHRFEAKTVRHYGNVASRARVFQVAFAFHKIFAALLLVSKSIF